jgi:hypothetical protein
MLLADAPPLSGNLGRIYAQQRRDPTVGKPSPSLTGSRRRLQAINEMLSHRWFGSHCAFSWKAATVGKVKRAFGDWHLRNLNWGMPRLIDVPTLSTKERLHLQRRLPCERHAGRVLRRALGYLIENDTKRTEGKLRQYADFHRYSPYFMKAVP